MQRNRTFDGCDPKVPPLPLHRLPHALRNHGRIVVDRERHSTLESLRPGDEHAEPATERIGRDPPFVWATPRLPASNDRSLDGLAAVARDTFDREHRERHTA